MGQKKRETRPSSRAQEPQQVDFGDEETVWSCLTYLPVCDQLYILKRHKSVIFAIKSRSAKRIHKYTNDLHELMRLCNTVLCAVPTWEGSQRGGVGDKQAVCHTAVVHRFRNSVEQHVTLYHLIFCIVRRRTNQQFVTQQFYSGASYLQKTVLLTVLQFTWLYHTQFCFATQFISARQNICIKQQLCWQVSKMAPNCHVFGC